MPTPSSSACWRGRCVEETAPDLHEVLADARWQATPRASRLPPPSHSAAAWVKHGGAMQTNKPDIAGAKKRAKRNPKETTNGNFHDGTVLLTTSCVFSKAAKKLLGGVVLCCQAVWQVCGPRYVFPRPGYVRHARSGKDKLWRLVHYNSHKRTRLSDLPVCQPSDESREQGVVCWAVLPLGQ